MSAVTMGGDFGTEKPVNRAPSHRDTVPVGNINEVPLGGNTHSKPGAEVVAEPVKEKKMEKAATPPLRPPVRHSAKDWAPWVAPSCRRCSACWC